MIVTFSLSLTRRIERAGGSEENILRICGKRRTVLPPKRRVCVVKEKMDCKEKKVFEPFFLKRFSEFGKAFDKLP